MLGVYLICVFGGVVIGQVLGGVLANQSGIIAPFWFAFIGSGVTWRWSGARSQRSPIRVPELAPDSRRSVG